MYEAWRLEQRITAILLQLYLWAGHWSALSYVLFDPQNNIVKWVLYSIYFTDEETEAQTYQVPCLRSQS